MSEDSRWTVFLLIVNFIFAVFLRAPTKTDTCCNCHVLEYLAINEDYYDLRFTNITRRSTPIVSMSGHGLLFLVTLGLYLLTYPPLSDLASAHGSCSIGMQLFRILESCQRFPRVCD